jgi:hypothetical protein
MLQIAVHAQYGRFFFLKTRACGVVIRNRWETEGLEHSELERDRTHKCGRCAVVISGRTQARHTLPLGIVGDHNMDTLSPGVYGE